VGGRVPPEFDATGVPVAERGARADEAIAWSAVWTEDGVATRAALPLRRGGRWRPAAARTADLGRGSAHRRRCGRGIPITVIEEIDRSRRTWTRSAGTRGTRPRFLERARVQGDLREGIAVDNGGCVRVLFGQDYADRLPAELAAGKGDNRILAVCLALKEQEKLPVIFVTKDTNLRSRRTRWGFGPRDYERGKVRLDEALQPAPPSGWCPRPRSTRCFETAGLRCTMPSSTTSTCVSPTRKTRTTAPSKVSGSDKAGGAASTAQRTHLGHTRPQPGAAVTPWTRSSTIRSRSSP